MANLLACKDNNSISEVHKEQKSFPLFIKDLDLNRELSAAMKRSFNHQEAPRLQDNELYTNFKYTKLKGFDYNNGDGNITRRDPSKFIFENGKYYVWYTHRETSTPPMGYPASNDTIPSSDWDLCDIWYATSTDGFTWEEQGAKESMVLAFNSMLVAVFCYFVISNSYIEHLFIGFPELLFVFRALLFLYPYVGLLLHHL